MGERLRNRYEILETLGRSSITSTHLALDHETGQRCVIEVLSLRRQDALEAHERLMREARVLQRLDHPAIPRFVDFFTEEGEPTRVCLVRQYAEGRSLSDLVASGRRFAACEAFRVGAKLAAVLEYLHGFDPPILHRDLQPAYVLVAEDGRVALVDFGSVRDHQGETPVLHQSGPTVVGTPGFMPIEQSEGRAVPASDLYALGATLVFLLTGRPSTDADRERRLDDATPGLPERTRRFLRRLLAPDWRDRPASAGDVRRELERFARARTLPGWTARLPLSRPLVWLAVLAAGFGLGLLVWSVAGGGSIRAPSQAPRATRTEAWERFGVEAGPEPRATGVGGAPEEVARDAVSPAAQVLPAPTPAAAELPAEALPNPREAVPEGRDVTAMIAVEERPHFTVHRFTGSIGRAQTLDLELGLGSVWVGTSLGLLRHDLRSGSWRHWDASAGLPGERLNEIAVAGRRVIVDSYTPTSPGSIRGTGVLAFDTVSLAWSRLETRGGVWDLQGDGDTLWLGLGQGAEMRDLAHGTTRSFSRGDGQLQHDTVHSVRGHGSIVCFAMLGDWVEASKDFAGGGVTIWDRSTDRFRSYTERDGLARGYSCDVFVDEREVFVAHWDEERGLSRLDRRTGVWERLLRSANGIDLGGVVLAGDADTLWIGQQGALVRLDRRSRQAIALREADGLPGYIVSGIGVTDDAVWASVYAYGGDGVRTAGVVRLPREPR